MKKFLGIIKNKSDKKDSAVFKNSRVSFSDPTPKFTKLSVGEWSSSSNPLTVHAYHTSELKL